jgi:hypothetical protein
MYAHNKHLLRATLIVSALMPATLAAAADLPLPPRTGLVVVRLLSRR